MKDTDKYSEFKNGSPVPNISWSFSEYFEAYNRATERCEKELRKDETLEEHIKHFHRAYFLNELAAAHLTNLTK